MALQKTVESVYGVSVEYFRVLPQVSIDYSSPAVRGQVWAYASQVARTAGSQAFCGNGLSRDIELAGEAAAAAIAAGDVRPALYSKLKEDSFFAGAVDV